MFSTFFPNLAEPCRVVYAGLAVWASACSAVIADEPAGTSRAAGFATPAAATSQPGTDGSSPEKADTSQDSPIKALDTTAHNESVHPSADGVGTDTPLPHRVEDVLQFARDGLQRIEQQVEDYTCTLVRRERIDGVWPDYFQRIDAKVRHEQRLDGDVVKPFALFLEFRNPRRMEGRQVIYVQDKWQGDLVARRGGPRSPNMTVQLDPSSPLAMDGNRYPITEFGIQKLATKLIEFIENELDHEDCEVKVFKNAKLEGRPCTHFQVIEKTRRPDSRFRLARVLVDNEYKVPVYYAAFGWGKGDQLVPLEEYAYINLQINIGLTDLDFDVENPDYHFQSSDESPVSD